MKANNIFKMIAKMDRYRYIIISPIILTLFVASSSYAGLFGKGEEESLRQQAVRYWNSKLTGDMITCYQLEEPAFKKAVPISQYVKGGNVIYKDVSVKEVQVDGDNATVIVELHYIIPALGSRLVFPDTVKDKWKKVDGKWFHHMKIEVPKYKRKTKERR